MVDRFSLPEGAVELVEERTRDSKTFALPGGGFRHVHGAYLHYRAGDAAHFPWLDVVSEPTYSAPGTWVRNEAQVMISANYNALQMTDRYTNISWMWVFVGTINWSDNDTIVYDGIPWKYRATPTGVKSDATVTSRQGVRTYSWQVNTNAQNVHVDDEGNIASDTFHIARAIIIGADGVEYEAGPWELPFPGVAQFTVDDSTLPDEAFPYLIDPSTSVAVDRSADDARWGDTQDFSNTSIINNLAGNSTATGLFHMAILFRPNIANNVTINSAWVRFVPYNSNGGTIDSTNNVITRITAAAQTNPAMVTSVTDANNRPRTVYVDWQMPHETNAAFQARAFIDTPDISTVIQAAIERIGRDAADSILLFLDTIVATSALHYRQVYSYDGNPTNAPVLHIDYSLPNDPPIITIAPTISYGSLTRLGPNNTPATVTAEAEDPEETGAGELTAEIRTAASGSGTLVATQNVTSGVPFQMNVAHNASGLTEGTNQLHMRVGDGTAWSDDAPFTVLVDRTPPSVGTITHSPNPVMGGG